ncbi:hypothetical protein BDZ94DRAFT_1246474 [Collybia nuda]|uniref:U3 small nucleolar RNA-associated protein 10 n=1 Tax=Collybia nuda TaxID=64659 RepID=A0A9P6CPS6_9AGAR|nr:hypothetical protein BDZ94DRAFT_1246474 [Collybia nuda]
MSSLAAQLAQNASLNTVLLVDRSRRKAGESYLFTGREADQHDLESIHALGINGLLQLASLNAAFREIEDPLFSEHAKTTDRTLLSAETNTDLDKSIATCLALLGPYLMEIPSGKVIEWLVRRFRINEFNVEALLSLFLPYHESPHFTKMITILHIKPNTTWSFLLAYKSAAQNLPRISLVTEMLRNSDVARFVTSLLPIAMKGGFSHRVLLAFNAASLHDFILRSRALDEGTLAYLLPALLEPLQHVPNVKDAVLGSYILLSALSHKCQIAPVALKTIVNAMTNCADGVLPAHFVNSILAVCERQPLLERFSDGTVKRIMRIPGVIGELKSACLWVGAEKIICPLLPGLEKRLEDEHASSLLETIISTSNLPPLVVNQLASLLLSTSLLTKITSASTTARRLLFIFQQRHPLALQEAAETLTQQDETLKESVEQLIVSLAVVQGIPGVNNGQADEIDMILASTNADSKVREIAVKNLLATLSIQNIDVSNMEAIHLALLARVQDTNQGVIDVLYEQPTIITPILVAHSQGYIDSISNTLTLVSSKPKRSLLRAHLYFIVSHFLPGNVSWIDDVFHRILFPFMLFSKPRQHTAEVVWDVISTNLLKPDGAKGAAHEWLVGCSASVESGREKSDVDPIQKMGGINTAIATQIARNILKSNNYSVHFEELFKKLQDSNHHTRILGYMITLSLLRSLSGEHQLEAVHKVLDVMNIEELTGFEDASLQNNDLSYVIDEKSLEKMVVMKPSGRSTSQWMQISIVTLVPTILPPAGVTLDWLTCSSTIPSDQRGPHYVKLMRKVYELANVSASVPHLTFSLLQTLFNNLKEDTLAFLAGVWISPTTPDYLSVIALHHASAFLQAHTAVEDGVDFQTILPSLIVAAQSQDKPQREGALACISLLRRLAEGKFSTVYKFDVIYGQNKNQLQYLDQDDLKKYLDALVDHQDHLLHDVNYIRTLHQLHLGTRKGDKKRESDYKYRVLCYILSHVNSVIVNDARITLLKAFDTVSNSAKANILLPIIQVLTTPRPANEDSLIPQELVNLLVSCFDATVANDLNDVQNSMWATFTAVIRNIYTSTRQSSQMILSRSLEQGLFAGLTIERKTALCHHLLDISSHDADAYAACKQLLGSLIQDTTLIVQLLNSLQPNFTGTPSRASKRAKLADTVDDSHQRLSLLTEVLGTRSLPGSLDLISHLLETLNRVIQSVSPAQADINYIQQLLMSAIENVANKITEIPNLSPSVIRLDILVELIRVAENPQTFHQALLLMANLARLAPDSVLHNVMPVFTFMGSNVFHRDDTYSFRVVQQTIDSIVPVMVTSLKSVHRQPLDLYVGSKEFLRVFTDAANHIPRHRRSNFFAHLVGVLGSDDFLPPISMLLVEKVSNRVIRQNSDDARSTLALPLSVIHQSSPDLQVQTLTEILRECQRLSARILSPNADGPTFLDVSPDDDHAASISTALKRRAQALLMFIGHSLKPTTSESRSPSYEENMGQLVTALISLATLQEGAGVETKIGDICIAARSTINQVLGVMSVIDFVKAVQSMIKSGDEKIQAGAMNLLCERLPDVSPKTRQEIVPTINDIIIAIKNVLTTKADGVLLSSALRAIRSIGLTLSPGEESSITSVIPHIIKVVKTRSEAPSALAALSPLPIKLGPRFIPYFREIILESVGILREGFPDVMEDTYAILLGLLASIPSFWSAKELSQVVTLYIEHCVTTINAPSPPMLRLMKTITKRALPTALLPMMIEMWTTVLKITPDLDRVTAYFDILTRAIRSSTRPAVLENLRSLFSIFIDSFDIVKTPSGKSHLAETYTIMAFKELVVKLNDAAFRPLFRRLYDWAFADKAADIARKIFFCHIYDTLLDFFKGLMNPYMSFLIEPFSQSLESFHSGQLDNQAYWSGIVQTLTKSFSFDDGAFWRDDKLRQMTTPLIQQVAVCINLNYSDGKTLLQECLTALTDTTTDDDLLKAINLDVLMHTRSEDARLRLLALTCSEALWRAHGGKLLGFVAETATFIAECSEDENDMIVRESFKLKDAVESVAGNINGL